MSQKTNEIFHNIMETSMTIEQLNDPIFIEEQGLTPEDVEEIRLQLEKEIEGNKEQILNKCDKLLILRRRLFGFISGNEEEKKLIDQTIEGHVKAIKKIDSFLTYVATMMNTDSKHKLSLQNGTMFMSKKAKRTEINSEKLPFNLFELKNVPLGGIAGYNEQDFNATWKMLGTLLLKDEGTLEEDDNIKVNFSMDITSLSKETMDRLIEAGFLSEEVIAKKKQKTQKEIKMRFETLSEEEKKQYSDVIKEIDNEFQLKIDEVKIN